MKNLFVVLATLTAFSTSAQTRVYHPFPESNASWNFNMTQGMCFMGGFLSEDYSLTFSGDTMIENQTYFKLVTPYVQISITGGCTQQNFPGYQGAIRQDISNKKVFFVPPAQSAEQLLYDFSMEAGDTVKGYLQTFNSPFDVVVEIDSVLVGSNYHKRWLINPCYDIYLIEGIGSTFGLLKPSPGCATDMNYYSLTCFSQDGQTLYPDFTICPLITSVSGPDDFSDQINIFPNPSNGSFSVGFVRPDDITEIRITDMIGNIVFRKQMNNQNNVSIHSLPGGSYILTVVDRKNRTANRKIVSCP
jgi:hypothetical protein